MILESFARPAANTMSDVSNGASSDVTDAAFPPADAALLDSALAGDRGAFAALYHRYQDVVFRFALHMGCGETAAEDVTQEVFLALLRNAGRYDRSRASFSTYLYGIARHITRRRRRRDRLFLAFGDTDRDQRHRASCWSKSRPWTRC